MAEPILPDICPEPAWLLKPGNVGVCDVQGEATNSVAVQEVLDLLEMRVLVLRLADLLEFHSFV